jgi:hypothetical protein
MYKNKIISFLLKYPEFFLGIASSNYHFSKNQLKQYTNVLDWNKISANENIIWNDNILVEFQDYIIWDTLTTNPSVFVNTKLLNTFEDKIDWFGNENFYGDSITANEGIYWDNETIEKYADKINFEKLSISTNVDWSETLLDKYIDKWDFNELAHNESIPWTLDMFKKYLDESCLFFFGVQTNKSLISFEMVEKYGHLMEWHNISLIPTLPWIEKDLLNCWSDKIVWTGIACNKFLFANDRNFFQKHYDKWQPIISEVLCYFSGNESFPWTKHLIEKYKPGIDWNLLCSNEGIVWDSDLIDSFQKHIIWGGWKPCDLFDETGNVISSVGGKRREIGLIDNKSVPWSIDFLQKYEHEFEFESLESNTVVWEKVFKPYIDDIMIETIIRII